MKYMLFIFFFIIKVETRANIIGGELNYELIDTLNYKYKITLELYNSLPSVASIRLYDMTNNLLNTFSVKQDTTFSLPLYDNYNCTQPSGYVFVSKTIYDTIVQLAPISGGYNLVYSACCFGSQATNIYPPANDGITFIVHIPDTSIVKYNSSPNFIEYPVLNFVRNDNIIIDMSANDIDGDSLVYKFKTPYDYNIGAPPYSDTIEWATVSIIKYYLTDLLGANNAVVGGVPLKINASTGLITGKSGGFLGSHLIPVEVAEYRNNVLLSKKINCFKLSLDHIDTMLVPRAIIDSVDFLNKCDDFTVDFDNNSSYFMNLYWDFGVPFLSDDTAFYDFWNPTTWDNFYPTYTYPDTGEYIIRLVVEHTMSNCYDTVYKTIRINYNSLSANFNFSGGECINSPIQLKDQSIDTIYKIVDWFWDFDDGKISIEQNPLYQFQNLNTYDVTLKVVNNVGCESTISIPFKIFTYFDPEIIEDQTIKYGSNAQLYIYDGIYYKWETNHGLLEDTLSNNPIVNPQVTTTYFVDVLSEDSCWASKSVTVNVYNNFVPNSFTPNGDGLNDQIKVRNTGLLSMQFNVFDRRGIRVFHGESPNDYWDGKLNGKGLPTGVYAYALEMNFNGGLTQFFKGNITLIR